MRLTKDVSSGHKAGTVLTVLDTIVDPNGRGQVLTLEAGAWDLPSSVLELV